MAEEAKRFPLQKSDLRLLRSLETSFRSFLLLPDLSPEDIVGIARAVRCVQRLPFGTEGIDVSISLDFDTATFVSSSTVRLSGDQIHIERSAASRLSEEYEFESFPGFNFSVDSDGDYEVEGNKEDFFEGLFPRLKRSGAAAAIQLPSSMIQ